ncbi:TetR/AcrR family transcriptional regulator [Alkaliphilus peptidifermentans]|uniref:Transcriptional regulator, TetR family n=1 Tax=Alkaliphilus peptidifermentans DSM 18978 TaxID=1120976 RepID=A0A1G5IMI7_9FIRM|nr:TetR/AcrR family transcriptional regulator [Alkaliphilus peptidifermentans]SCY77217.1 transcriptional regulator, TetR family [Alkaliphilus peptidifermentans DSM 18978]
MKTKKGEVTRNHIIQAAEQLFMEKSVSKVTISEIVQRAGVAKGTFYLYFESKDELVWNFMDHKFGHADKWMKEILLKGYSDEDICEIVKYIVSFVKKNITVLKMMHNVRFHSFLGIKRMEEKYMKRWVKPFSLWLEKGRLEGILKINDSEFMAHYLIITMHELFDRVIMNELPLSIDEVGDELKILILKLLK